MANNILVYGTANPAPSAIPLALQRQQQEAAAQGTSSAPLTAENLANQSGGTGGTLSSMPYRPLNVRDALSYLDEVKVQFSAQPEVYNRFLDIMKDFKTQTIDTPGVIDRVSSLFRLHPALIQGFNTFLPPGYRIDFYCPYGGDPNTGTIYVTTPTGTTASKPGQGTNLTGRFPPPVSDVQKTIDLHQRIKERLGEDASRQIVDLINKFQADPAGIEIIAVIQPLMAGAVDLFEELKQSIEPPPPAVQLPPPTKTRRPAAASSKARAAAANYDEGAPPAKKKRTASSHQPPPVASSSKAAPVAAQRPAVESSVRQTVAAPAQPPIKPPAPTRARISTEELNFFDKIGRYIDDRTVYHEFLKLCNLYTQDIIDLPTLVERAHLFIGTSKELWAQFREVVQWRDDRVEGKRIDEMGVWHIDNTPTLLTRGADVEREAYGPSYRKLPDSDLLLACSGRDQLCWDVLNDQWVSAPTWASEEGFLATKKNANEEALHRSEEERYEYDYHIDAIQRTLTLLEPIAARIAQMDSEERSAFRLKPGLGGHSKSVYPAVLKKVYGAEQGLEVIQALHDNPVLAVPIVHARLKQKEEEWRKALRDWKPVWREIDEKNYYKALDYQATTIKANDKKLLLAKTLVTEIETVRREQQMRALAQQIAGGRDVDALSRSRDQLTYAMPDQAVFFDALKLVLAHLDRTTSFVDADKDQIEQLLREIAKNVFDIPLAVVDAQLAALPPPPGADVDNESDGGITSDIEGTTTPASNAGSTGRSRSRKGGGDLRKRALRNATAPGDRAARRRDATAKASSPGPTTSSLVDVEGGGSFPVPIGDLPSAETNPAAVAGGERPVPSDDAVGLDAMEGVETVAAPTDEAPSPVASLTEPLAGQASREASPLPAVEASIAPQIPDDRRLNFFCGSNLYIVLRLLQILHSRLLAIKLASPKISASREAFAATEDSSAAYEAVLDACQKLFANEIDNGAFEDALRALMGTAGYPVYTIDKIVLAVARALQTSLDPSENPEEKPSNLLRLLQRHRRRGCHPRQEVAYRAEVEAALAGTGESVYRVEWKRSSSMLVFQVLGKDEMVAEDETAATKLWESYMVSFVSSERTAGLESIEINPSILTKHLLLASDANAAMRVRAHAGLGIKFCLRSLKMLYAPGTEDWLFRHDAAPAASRLGRLERVKAKRVSKFDAWLKQKVGGEDVVMKA